MTQRRRYALVGLGGRSEMFREAALETFKETSELVGVCDRNEGRVRLAVEHARERGVAANRSMASGQPVQVADLVTGVELPDYP